MLDTKYNQSVSAYKFYRKDLESKNIKGSDYDEVVRLDERINQIAAECEPEDIMGFMQKINTEGIATKLNDAYMRAISAPQKNDRKVNSGISGTKDTINSVLSAKSTGSIVEDVKRLKNNPTKENAIGLAKETGHQTFRLIGFIKRIRRTFGF